MSLQKFISEVTRRLRHATPGPWDEESCCMYEPDSNGPDSYRGAAPVSYNCTEYRGGLGVTPEQALYDADLIAHAPTDLSKLLEVVEMQQRWLSRIAENDADFVREYGDPFKMARKALAVVDESVAK